MKTTVELKYSLGDKVSVDTSKIKYKYYKYITYYGITEIPVDENEFTIDGYKVIFEENKEPTILYVFHCYMNIYFGYHDLLVEDCLTPIGENHPQTIDVEFKDAFGEGINFGDRVFSWLYSNYKGEGGKISTKSMSFIKCGIVTELCLNENIHGDYDRVVTFDITMFQYTNINVGNECDVTLCKSVPDNFYKEIIDNAWNRLDYFESKYDAPKFKELMDVFGQYELAKAYYDDLENKRIKAKTYREKRKAQPKTNKKPKKATAKSISKDINTLSKEEKAKLLKMLMGNEE